MIPSARLPRIVMVAGNTYGFESVYLPVLRQLSGVGTVRCYVMDYPKGASLGAIRSSLASMAHVESFTLIPNDLSVWAHHRALARECRRLRAGPPIDLLVVDGDVIPMCRYFIDLARARGSRVVAMQKEVPKGLLLLDRRRREGAERLAPGSSASRSVVSWPRRLWRRLGESGFSGVVSALGGNAAAAAWRLQRGTIHFRLLPLLFAGRPFGLTRLEQRGLDLAPRRADLVLVYNEQVKAAIGRFAPELRVLVAEHPLAGACRCEGRPRGSRLLVALTGPWRNYADANHSLDAMQARWAELIEQAMAVGRLSAVDIRAHPRETGPHPDRLVDALRARRLEAELADPRQGALAGVVCRYAAVMGPPSGALAEAAAACRRASVLCVAGMQGAKPEAAVEGFSPAIVRVGRDEPIRSAHFIRPDAASATAGTVGGILGRILLGESPQARAPRAEAVDDGVVAAQRSG